MCGDSAARTGLFLLLIHFAFTVIVAAWQGGTPWASPDEEALDEINDADILRAVRQSVAALDKRMSTRSHRRKRAETSVCYDGVGCFRDSGPYGYIDMLPSPPEEIATRFLLYNSRKNRRGDTPLLDVAFTNLTAVFHWAGQAFNISAPTKVIVHGFGSSCSHVWVYEMRSALMSVEDCNIICVDWEGGATLPNYVRASANARLVGKQVAMLISGLNEKLGLPLNNVHLIGFSLGAHVAGFAGAELKNLSRITGLDPAGPLFESQDPRARLDSSDAHFVDVIHSNGENLILGGLGSWQPMGHVDFYPNGGRMQKGCSNLFVGAVTDIFLSVSEVEGRSLCNHRRAYKFFTDSVSPRCHFPSVSCETFDKYAAGMCFPCSEYGLCGNMGYYADKSSGRGTQFLVTREEEPFCANQYLVKVDSTKSVLPVMSYGKIQLTLISDLDLNETFTLTMKDDEELKVGASLSKIIVPHPAIQEFKTVKILYTAYSGWISSGLGKWSIDRIVLTDAYSKSLSVCRKGLVLESGVPIVLPLFPGECNAPSKGSHESPNKKNVSNSTNSSRPSSLYNITKYKPTQVVKIGDEILNISVTEKKDENITLNEDIPSHYLSAPWQPVLEYPEVSGNSGNGIEPASEDSGRGFITTREIPKDKNISYAEKNKTATTKTSNDALVLGELVMVREVNSTSTINSSTKLEDLDRRLKMELSGELLTTNKNKTKNKDDPPYEFVKVSKQNILFENSSSTSRPEIKEPILSATTQRVRTSSKLENGKWIPRTDLNPPSMGATESWLHWESISGRKVKNLDLDKSESKNETERSFSLFTVQLLPQRLVSFLEQAERYARIAFSPFVSNDPETRGQRRLKFLPQSWYSDNTKRSNSDTNKKNSNLGLDKESTTDSPRIAIPFPDEKPSYIPKFIPLKQSDQTTPVPKAEKDFNRPDMIVEHMEEPMIEEMEVKNEKTKDGKTR